MNEHLGVAALGRVPRGRDSGGSSRCLPARSTLARSPCTPSLRDHAELQSHAAPATISATHLAAFRWPRGPREFRPYDLSPSSFLPTWAIALRSNPLHGLTWC